MRRLAVLAALVALSAAPTAAPAEPYRHHANATAVGSGGAAATVDSVATDAAIRTLEAGGNAVDAAVVAAAVLGVTDPFSCGIGGGGFLVAYSPHDGRVTTLDHREEAPAAMQPDSFFDEAGKPLSFTAARFSGMSAGVPGTVAGWAEALERHGTFTLAEALAPAIDVAKEGFVIDDTFQAQIAGNVDAFDDIPSTARLFLDEEGRPKRAGTVFRNPDLARAYERIAQLGPKGFYRGAIADAMVDAVRHPPVAPNAGHAWRPGVMTLQDVRRYDAVDRPPTRVGYRGLDVFGMGPPSSGGSTVGEALNVLEGFDLPNLEAVKATHLTLEASRFAFADRNAYVADPRFFDVPLRGLLSDGFAAERRALITSDRAAASPVAPGNPYPHDGGGAGGQASTTVLRTGSTTHITTADAAGGVASYTFTIESVGGNGIVVPGWGFLLNNELTDFDFTSHTHPNRVEGGKRPRSSMSPTIVLRDGRPVLALGSPGGSTIITTVLQVLVDRFDRDRALPEAIAAPRASQRNARMTSAEPGFPNADVLRDSFGHLFTVVPEIGAATAIELLPDGRALAAAEPVRRGGGAAGAVAP